MGWTTFTIDITEDCDEEISKTHETRNEQGTRIERTYRKKSKEHISISTPPAVPGIITVELNCSEIAKKHKNL